MADRRWGARLHIPKKVPSWEFGPEAYKKAIEELREHAPLTRLLSAGQIGLGLFIASLGYSQEEE
jgi:hypothetical protein